MIDLRQHIASVPDFPKPGILFRDIMPLLRDQFGPTVDAMDALLEDREWQRIDCIGGIESRGFILGAAMALRRGKGFVAIRKRGKLPPPVQHLDYALEYGQATIEMQPGRGGILIVDDVIATGGSMSAAAELCERSGYQVQAMVALLDLKLVPSVQWHGLAARCALSFD